MQVAVNCFDGLALCGSVLHLGLWVAAGTATAAVVSLFAVATDYRNRGLG